MHRLQIGSRTTVSQPGQARRDRRLLPHMPVHPGRPAWHASRRPRSARPAWPSPVHRGMRHRRWTWHRGLPAPGLAPLRPAPSESSPSPVRPRPAWSARPPHPSRRDCYVSPRSEAERCPWRQERPRSLKGPIQRETLVDGRSGESAASPPHRVRPACPCRREEARPVSRRPEPGRISRRTSPPGVPRSPQPFATSAPPALRQRCGSIPDPAWPLSAVAWHRGRTRLWDRARQAADGRIRCRPRPAKDREDACGTSARSSSACHAL